MRQQKVEPKHLMMAAVALTVPSWFIISSLISGQIRMGLSGRSSIVSRYDQPNEYWVSVGVFLLLILFGWFGLGLNVYRLVRDKRNRKRIPPK